jgi:hypothetical protein
MWQPRRLTTLWASTACYRDNFIFDYFILVYNATALWTVRVNEVHTHASANGGVSKGHDTLAGYHPEPLNTRQANLALLWPCSLIGRRVILVSRRHCVVGAEVARTQETKTSLSWMPLAIVWLAGCVRLLRGTQNFWDGRTHMCGKAVPVRGRGGP